MTLVPGLQRMRLARRRLVAGALERPPAALPAPPVGPDEKPHFEIDPATKAVVWKFPEPRVADFFSPRLSNAQRLSNGNTLINEGWFGRFFEVTPGGEILWEYVNPYFGARQNFVVNAVQRAYRYSADEIAKARTAT